MPNAVQQTNQARPASDCRARKRGDSGNAANMTSAKTSGNPPPTAYSPLPAKSRQDPSCQCAAEHSPKRQADQGKLHRRGAAPQRRELSREYR